MFGDVCTYVDFSGKYLQKLSVCKHISKLHSFYYQCWIFYSDV